MVVFCRLIMRNTSWKKELGKAFVSFRSKFSGAFSVCHAFGDDNHKGGLCMNMREYHWHWDNFDALHSGYALRWTDHHHHCQTIDGTIDSIDQGWPSSLISRLNYRLHLYSKNYLNLAF